MKPKYCPKCGSELKNNEKYCSNCGNKIENDATNKINDFFKSRLLNLQENNEVLSKINDKIEIQNNQISITKKAWYLAGFFFLIIFLAFSEIIDIHPAIIMISIFLFIMSLIIGFMFRSREKKLQKLIDGNSLIASWKLSDEQKNSYVENLFKEALGKNLVVLFSISSIAIIVFGLFILFIDEGKLFMLIVLLGLIILLSIFAFSMPYYYRYKNNKGDGVVLLGKKYAYINGYFHNWDFPLSGIEKVRIIDEPFYGLSLVYYYTDRTLQHRQELNIPANIDINLSEIVDELNDVRP